MNRWHRLAIASGIAAGVFLACQGCLWAGAPEPPEQPEPAVATHGDQVSQDLLKRLAAEQEVERKQRLHMAEQHFKTGKVHFELQDWQKARTHFEKALELNPLHSEAGEYLRKARSMLGIEQGSFGDLMRQRLNQEHVIRQEQSMELHNAFSEAKALYDRGQYREAIEAFVRVRAKANYLAPFFNTTQFAEDAAAYQQKASEALEREKQEAQKRRLDEAIEQSRRFREERANLLAARNQARLDQARLLYDQHRYDQARTLCDAILRDDPGYGAAADLRKQALDTRDRAIIDSAVADRRRETELHWRLTDAWLSPQNDIVSMPRELFEIVKNRVTPVMFGGKQIEEQPWEKQLRERLSSQKISFDFVETPLPDVLAFLSSLTDTSMILDPESLRDGAPSVTLRVNEMTLERALNWICKLVNLKYGLKDEAIFVGHPDKIRTEVVLRMYDVSDLTMEIKNFAGRSRALATDQGWGQDQGGGGEFEDFFREPEEEDEDRLTGDKLIEFIRRMIAPGSWERDDAEILEQPFSQLLDDESPRARAGRELVDIVGLAVGGRQWVGIRTRE